MKSAQNNYAYIDGTNLHKGISELGWKLNYKRFRIWLAEKYGVTKAYLFFGFISTNTNLYRDLQNFGYTLIFKPTLRDGDGRVKGNCDAEMVLQAISDFYEKKFNQAVIVTGDGDFACLVKFLDERGGLKTLLCPNHQKASVLLRKSVPEKIVFLDRFKQRLS